MFAFSVYAIPFEIGPIANIIQDNYASFAADINLPDKIEATLIIPFEIGPIANMWNTNQDKGDLFEHHL